MINETLKTLVKEETYSYITNNYPSIKHLVNASKLELLSIPGIGPSTAQKLKAIFELSQELLKPDEDDYFIKQPKDAYDYLKSMALYNEENLIVLYLNTKNKVIFKKLISRGSINSSIVHPREVFAEAVRINCASLILAHNHPSNNCSPSNEDISITHRLKECSKIIGIELMDHLIIGAGSYVSLKEKGVL
jgi:DNA repair protein RadC